MSDSLQPHGLQHARLPCPSPTPGACSNSCPLSWWCHPTISPSVIPFSSFNLSQHQGLLQWVSRLHQVAKMNIQDWFILIAFINTFTINISKTTKESSAVYKKIIHPDQMRIISGKQVGLPLESNECNTLYQMKSRRKTL